VRRRKVVVALVLLAGLAVGGVAVAEQANRPTLWASGDGMLGSGDGEVGDGPGQLQPGVARAFGKAQSAAAAEGVTVTVTSGWRSTDQQQRLFEEAVQKYGSPEVARQWVLPPNESAHVQGGAIDVGPPKGAAWLDQHGVRFGLCRTYDNEPWHFELLAADLGSDCPARKPHA
jgi:zinc D-Ala-D-Ala carboxypeptidase